MFRRVPRVKATPRFTDKDTDFGGRTCGHGTYPGVLCFCPCLQNPGSGTSVRTSDRTSVGRLSKLVGVSPTTGVGESPLGTLSVFQDTFTCLSTYVCMYVRRHRTPENGTEVMR